MSEEPSANVTEFHRQLASELFSHVLGLLAQPDRTCAENDRMIHAAHASRFHWEFGGTPANLALGEWQCARVHTALRQPDAALHHAWRYLEFVETYGLGPFHLAYAHSALAAAFALEKPEEAAHHEARARELSAHIEDEEGRALVETELTALHSGPAPAAPCSIGSTCC